MISASLVKELREKTGVGLMDCKKALQDVEGDLEAAIQFLREKGIAKAAKKADRSTNEGKIFVATSDDKKSAVIVELNCETDFVAGNDDFSTLGNIIAKTALSTNVTSLENSDQFKYEGTSLNDLISEYVLKLGENIQVSKLQRVDAEACVSNYIHMNGKIGVLVSFNEAVSDETGLDIAMHIAATNPIYTTSAEVPQDEIAKEQEIIRAQAKNEGRPDAVVEKIVTGKIDKYYQEVCLIEQVFIKDDKKKIKQVIPSEKAIKTFIRYSLV